MAGIRSALTNLIAIQDALAITNPISTSIAKAYKYPPDRDTALDFPAIINTWSFLDQGSEDGSFSQGHHRYSVEMQCLIRDADLSRGIDIATAFWEAWLTAWVADQQLTNGGASTILATSLTGAAPTIQALEWSGVSYPGWTATLDGLIPLT